MSAARGRVLLLRSKLGRCPLLGGLTRATLTSLALLVGLTLPLTSGPSARATELVDRIVAVVNDEVITATELEQALQRNLEQLQQRLRAEQIPGLEVLRRQALQRLILRRIQIQRARERGIEVSAQDVDQVVAQLAQRNGLSVAQFRETLKYRGWDYAAYRQRLKEQLLRKRLIDQQVRAQVQVTDDEVASFLARQQAGKGLHHEVKLQHLLVAVPEEASPQKIEDLREKAEKLLDRLRQGAEFAALAAAESDGQKALDGGMLGWFKPGEFPTAVQATIEALKPGEHSEVIRTPSGFHIFRLLDRRPLEAAQQPQVRARHILLRTRAGQSPKKGQSLARRLLRKVRSGDDFAKLAKKFSDGPAAGKGGDLGWVSRGQLAPEVERVLFSLDSGEVGGPIRSPYGFHLVQALDKRKAQIKPANRRRAARHALRKRKTREHRKQWLRQLRAQAYVDIRL